MTRVRRYLLVVLAAVLCATAVPASALPRLPVGKSNRGDGHFHVRGTKIIGPNGGVFTPRGVNLGGLEQTPKGYNLGYWNFKQMKDWGANFVRVALSDAFWLKSMCTYDSTYASRVDQIVRWGEQLKMLVLLDNHHGTQGKTCGTGKWHNLEKMPDIHNLAFIKQLAKRYKNKPYVAFDLYNEPHDVPESIWRNGGIVDGYRGIGMQQMLEGVRSTGAKNLVVVTGNHWGNNLEMVIHRPLLPDKDVVYGAHGYPYQCDGKRWYDEPFMCHGKRIPQHLDAEIAPAIPHRAVILAEFGTYRPYAGEIAEPIAWAERHGIGWAAWLWCNSSVRNFCLLQPGGGAKPSVIGQPVFDALRASKPKK